MWLLGRSRGCQFSGRRRATGQGSRLAGVHANAQRSEGACPRWQGPGLLPALAPSLTRGAMIAAIRRLPPGEATAAVVAPAAMVAPPSMVAARPVVAPATLVAGTPKVAPCSRSGKNRLGSWLSRSFECRFQELLPPHVQAPATCGSRLGPTLGGAQQWPPRRMHSPCSATCARPLK